MPEGVNWRDGPVHGDPVQGEPVSTDRGNWRGKPSTAATKMAAWHAQGSSQLPQSRAGQFMYTSTCGQRLRVLRIFFMVCEFCGSAA